MFASSRQIKHFWQTAVKLLNNGIVYITEPFVIHEYKSFRDRCLLLHVSLFILTHNNYSGCLLA